MRQKPYTANNIVNVYLCPDLYILKDNVNLILNIGNQVNIAHDWDLKDFLATICNNNEYETIIRM